MACEPGTTAKRNYMIPKLGMVLKDLKSDENMLVVYDRLQKLMTMQKPDRVPAKAYNCTKNICLKNIYSNMQNASRE